MSAPADVLAKEEVIDWQERLTLVTATMRDMSRQTDPQKMRRHYVEHMRRLRPVDGSVSISRRGLTAPWYRITRSTHWKEEIDPWKEPERLPLCRAGCWPS